MWFADGHFHRQVDDWQGTNDSTKKEISSLIQQHGLWIGESWFVHEDTRPKTTVLHSSNISDSVTSPPESQNVLNELD
eukprot:2323154-Amphidinium_carterae.1